MIFKYNGKTYQGTREEIQTELSLDIIYFELKWEDDAWRFGSNSLEDDCTPSCAKEILRKQILNQVPQKEIKFDGKSFQNIEDLEPYLLSLPLISIGYGMFSLGECTEDYYGKTIKVFDIKKQINEKILCSLK